MNTSAFSSLFDKLGSFFQPLARTVIADRDRLVHHEMADHGLTLLLLKKYCKSLQENLSIECQNHLTLYQLSYDFYKILERDR